MSLSSRGWYVVVAPVGSTAVRTIVITRAHHSAKHLMIDNKLVGIQYGPPNVLEGPNRIPFACHHQVIGRGPS